MAVLKILNENQEWIEVPAIPGPEGQSAYDVAVSNGFQGTEEEWLDSLSNRKWKHLRDITINSSLKDIMSTAEGTGMIFSFSTDKNGKPFSCTEFFIVFAGRPAFTNDYYAPLCIANLENSDFSKINSTKQFETSIVSGDGANNAYSSGTIDIISNTVIKTVGSQIRYAADDYASYVADIHLSASTDGKELVPWTNLAIGIWDPGTQAMSTQYGFAEGSQFWIYGR